MIDEHKTPILLLDDDKFLLNMYGAKFAAAGYDVQACISGKIALDILRGGFHPEAVLFDVTMPEMDGFAFLKVLQDEKLAEGALKIALTNQNDDAERQRAEELGATRYFVKASMIPSEVVGAVGEELAKKK